MKKYYDFYNRIKQIKKISNKKNSENEAIVLAYNLHLEAYSGKYRKYCKSKNTHWTFLPLGTTPD
jgi:hypothetical protein